MSFVFLVCSFGCQKRVRLFYVDEEGNEYSESGLEFRQDETIENLIIPEKYGYKFLGWHLDGKKVESITPKKGDKEITLVAKWEPLLCKMKFVDYYGNVKNYNIKYGESFSEYYKEPEKLEGLDFVGWYVQGENRNAKEVIKKDDKFENFIPDQDLILKAAYTPSKDVMHYYEIGPEGIPWEQLVVLKKYSGGASNLMIPNFYNGKFINRIGQEAFGNNNTLERVTLPSSIEKVNFRSFWHCSNLKEVNFNKGLKEIDGNAFSSFPKIERITFPGTLEKIGEEAFLECTGLKEVKLNPGLEEIGKYAFFRCENLTHIQIPSVKRIGNSAFSDCKNLLSVTLSAETIGKGAFFKCTNLKEVKLNDGLKEIEESAFYECENLEEIIIPITVHTIEERAFCWCLKLKTFNVRADKKPENWKDNWDFITPDLKISPNFGYKDN